MKDSFKARPRLRYLYALVVVGAGVLAYSSSFRGAFVLDDARAVIESPRVRHVLPRAGEWVARRAFAKFTFAVNYATGRLNTADYHLTNLFIHLSAALVLFGLVRLTLSRPSAWPPARARASALATVVAVLWVVHPLTTSAVTYICQRYESLMSLFYLLVLYGVARGHASQRGWPWYVMAVGAAVLGMASKEIMLTVPIAVLLYDRLLLAGSFRELIKRRWGLYLGLAGAWGWLLLLMRSGVEPGSPVQDVYGSFPSWSYLLVQGRVIMHYLRLSVWPHPLLLDYGAAAGSVVALGAVAVLGLACLFAIRRAPAIAFVGLLFFIVLAPTSSIAARPDPVFEHRMYLPLAGVVTLLVCGCWAMLHRMLGQTGRRVQFERFALILCLVAAVALGITTYGRNSDYASEQVLWQQVADRFPANRRASLNLAGHALKAGRPADAARLIEAFLSCLPEGVELGYSSGAEDRVSARDVVAYGRACNTLGLAYMHMGRSDDGIAKFRAALRATPGYGRARSNLGVALFETGRTEEAVAELKRAVEQDGGSIETHQSLAEAYRVTGNAEAARTHYRAILRLDPGHELARLRLGED